MGKMFVAFFVIILAYLAYKFYNASQSKPIPKLENTWWGPGASGTVDTKPRPFSINISNEELEDLKWRLDHHRPFTPPLENVQQQYGMNTELLQEIVDHWRTKYNWREREKFLNKFPQFKINVQGLDIHYLHVKPSDPKGAKVVPLLMIHGWPGSVREFYDILPILTKPSKDRDFVFEVYAPHIPGYGFSQAAVRPGLGAAQIAVLFKNFMKQLGHDKFYAQGGDFGSIILHSMAVLHPENILGFHSNMLFRQTPKAYFMHWVSSIAPWLPWCYVRPEHYERVFPLREKLEGRIRETGYLHLQATKPDTLGVAMNESPIGLAAYILEKFTTGTKAQWQKRKDGGLKEVYTYDDLLDNVMIYWWTKSATTSFRLYAESFSKVQSELGISSHKIPVLMACARFKNDFYLSDGIIKDTYPNLVQLSDYDGGHFAAFQLPEVFADDVFAAVEKFEAINRKK